MHEFSQLASMINLTTSCVQTLAKLQDAMRANVEDAQQKIRLLRKSVTAKERQLTLAKRTIERLSNERTLMQVRAATT